jgi:hypothetical protein
MTSSNLVAAVVRRNKAAGGRMSGFADLVWRREGEDHVVYRRGGRRPLARLIPDAKHPGMWRALYPNEQFGDLLVDVKNLTRACHEASLLVLAELNRRRRQKQVRGEPEKAAHGDGRAGVAMTALPLFLDPEATEENVKCRKIRNRIDA